MSVPVATEPVWLYNLLGHSGLRVEPRQTLNRVLLAASLATLISVIGVVGAALFYRSTLHYQMNYNEGWNSYFVQRVLDGAPLYPERSTRLINNYPPLSFYITAGVAKLTGSVLVAGRLISWCAYLACAALIGLIVRRLGCNGVGALLGSLFFAAAVAVRYDRYVGMFDPHLLGQALMLAGLLVLLRGRSRDAALAAVLVVAGGFVKHSLIALPITVTLWLALFRRRQFIAWVCTGGALAAAGLAACMALFGTEFVSGLTAPRRAELGLGVRKVLRWLLPIELPCLLALLPALVGGAEGALIGLYLLVAVGAGVIGAAAHATNYNMIFEALAAISLGVGFVAGRSTPLIPAGWVALACSACVLLAGAEVATVETTSWRAWSAAQHEREATALATVESLRRRPGPALCGTLLYCYAAGKPFVWDPLNYGMAPGQDQSELISDIVNRRFSSIQIDTGNLYFSEKMLQVVREHYSETIEHSGVFLPLP